MQVSIIYFARNILIYSKGTQYKEFNNTIDHPSMSLKLRQMLSILLSDHANNMFKKGHFFSIGIWSKCCLTFDMILRFRGTTRIGTSYTSPSKKAKVSWILFFLIIYSSWTYSFGTFWGLLFSLIGLLSIKSLTLIWDPQSSFSASTKTMEDYVLSVWI